MTTSVVDRPLTQKQESFCLFIFQGFSQRDAYLKAGYSSRGGLATVDVESSRLMDLPKVSLRIAELRQKAEDAAVMTVHERKSRLSEVGRANLTDFIDENGIIKLQPSAALAEYSVSKVKRSIKLRDPIAAIDSLNKMERIGTPDNVLPQNINIVFVIGKGYANQTPLLGEGKVE